VPQLLQTAARRAQAEGLDLDTQEADAQSLPFADGAFDVVLSTFGVMFAPDQSRAAADPGSAVDGHMSSPNSRVDLQERVRSW